MKLWKHQEDALKEFSTRNSYGLFFEMGTGKTLTAIECYNFLCNTLNKDTSEQEDTKEEE